MAGRGNNNELHVIYLALVSAVPKFRDSIWHLYVTLSKYFQSAAVRVEEFQIPNHRQYLLVTYNFLTLPNETSYELNDY
jgi:hypothetical protein